MILIEPQPQILQPAEAAFLVDGEPVAVRMTPNREATHNLIVYAVEARWIDPNGFTRKDSAGVPVVRSWCHSIGPEVKVALGTVQWALLKVALGEEPGENDPLGLSEEVLRTHSIRLAIQAAKAVEETVDLAAIIK